MRLPAANDARQSGVKWLPSDGQAGHDTGQPAESLWTRHLYFTEKWEVT